MFQRLAAIAAVCASATTAAAGGLTFNDPLLGQQWYLEQLNLPAAWEAVDALPQRGQITVGVLDSGFETAHSDFSNLLLGDAINIVDYSANLAPVHPHGTGTAGLPGAQSGNALGISQAAWTADVLPIKVSNRSDGAAYLSDLADAVAYAVDHRARVIDISYGGINTSIMEQAARYAHERGALVFMAAGNSGRLENSWNNSPYIVAVGATDQNDNRASFSTYGSFVDFGAPGVSITSLYTDDSFASWNGTSFASPLAASVAAVIWTANPLLSNEQVFDIMTQSTNIQLPVAERDELFSQRDEKLDSLEAKAEAKLEKMDEKLDSKLLKLDAKRDKKLDKGKWDADDQVKHDDKVAGTQEKFTQKIAQIEDKFEQKSGKISDKFAGKWEKILEKVRATGSVEIGYGIPDALRGVELALQTEGVLSATDQNVHLIDSEPIDFGALAAGLDADVLLDSLVGPQGFASHIAASLPSADNSGSSFASAGAAVSSIPEPSALALVGLGCMLLIARPRR